MRTQGSGLLAPSPSGGRGDSSGSGKGKLGRAIIFGRKEGGPDGRFWVEDYREICHLSGRQRDRGLL